MLSMGFLQRTCGITTFAGVAPRVGMASMSTGNRHSLPPTNSYDGIVCDMDGVLWRGQEEISRSIDALNVLKHRGKSIVFVTNSSSKTRIAIARRLSSLGYDAKTSDIITAGSVTADFLYDELVANLILPTAEKKSKAKVFMIGNSALKDELESRNFEVLYVPDNSSVSLDEEELVHCQKSLVDDVKAVVVGVDLSFTYRKLSIGGLYLQGGSRKFVTTNPDNCNRVSNGAMHPEAGSLAAALQSLSGIKPTVCGKPSRIIVEHVLKQLQSSNPRRLLMVGDRLDTDIAFANTARFSSCLVLSGVTTEEEAEEQFSGACDARKTPDFLARDLWDMVSPLSTEDMRMLAEFKKGKINASPCTV